MDPIPLERSFVYRTVPEGKFDILSTNKMSSSTHLALTFVFIKTSGQMSIFFGSFQTWHEHLDYKIIVNVRFFSVTVAIVFLAIPIEVTV